MNEPITYGKTLCVRKISIDYCAVTWVAICTALRQIISSMLSVCPPAGQTFIRPCFSNLATYFLLDELFTFIFALNNKQVTFNMQLKALGFLYSFEEPTDFALLSSFCEICSVA